MLSFIVRSYHSFVCITQFYYHKCNDRNVFYDHIIIALWTFHKFLWEFCETLRFLSSQKCDLNSKIEPTTTRNMTFIRKNLTKCVMIYHCHNSLYSISFKLDFKLKWVRKTFAIYHFNRKEIFNAYTFHYLLALRRCLYTDVDEHLRSFVRYEYSSKTLFNGRVSHFISLRKKVLPIYFPSRN